MNLTDSLGISVTLGDTIELVTRRGFRRGELRKVTYLRDGDITKKIKRTLHVYVTCEDGEDLGAHGFNWSINAEGKYVGTPSVWYGRGENRVYTTAPFILIEQAPLNA